MLPFAPLAFKHATCLILIPFSISQTALWIMLFSWSSLDVEPVDRTNRVCPKQNTQINAASSPTAAARSSSATCMLTHRRTSLPACMISVPTHQPIACCAQRWRPMRQLALCWGSKQQNGVLHCIAVSTASGHNFHCLPCLPHWYFNCLHFCWNFKRNRCIKSIQLWSAPGGLTAW